MNDSTRFHDDAALENEAADYANDCVRCEDAARELEDAIAREHAERTAIELARPETVAGFDEHDRLKALHAADRASQARLARRMAEPVTARRVQTFDSFSLSTAPVAVALAACMAMELAQRRR